MKRSNLLAAMVASVLCLSACGAAPDPTVSASELASRHASAAPHSLRNKAVLNAWREQHAETFKSLGTAAVKLASAINHGDFDSLHNVCRDITTVNLRVRKTLPAPDPALTTELRQMSRKLDELTSTCPALGFTSNTGDFSAFGADIRSAAFSFERARAIMRDAESN